jgi:hypothetical protein
MLLTHRNICFENFSDRVTHAELVGAQRRSAPAKFTTQKWSHPCALRPRA